MEVSQTSNAYLAAQVPLNVALKTMKERCFALEKRLIAVEEENQELRHNGNRFINENVSDDATEILQLRMQITDLQKQKTQLTEQINMVYNENRKLWSRLSQIAKDQGKTTNAQDNDNTLINDEDTQGLVESPRVTVNCGGANHNLIRSKTFTQHSPNPHLRHKLISTEVGTSGMKDVSLQEVNLDIGSGSGEAYAEGDYKERSFGYLHVEDASTSGAANNSAVNEAEFNVEFQKCIEGMQELRREVLLQNKELHSAYTMVKNRIALNPCPDCAKKSKKPEMADKSLETDESLNECQYYNNNTALQESSICNGHNTSGNLSVTTHLNIIQEKIKADSMDKTCPMCGKIFSELISFDSFRNHVEMHFIDDSNDVEASIDRNFELISHAVGDF